VCIAAADDSAREAQKLQKNKTKTGGGEEEELLEAQDDKKSEKETSGKKNPRRSDLEEVVRVIVAEDGSLGVKYVLERVRARHPAWLVGRGLVSSIEV
jgi:hypothetical protein